jgi:signal transduction histidine kinase
MPPDEKPRRRVFGAVILGLFIAVVNYVLDRVFDRLGHPSATTFFNDLIIGSAAGLFAFIWMARQAARNALARQAEKLSEEILQKERKRIALELHDTVCQEQTGAILQLEVAGNRMEDNSKEREHVFRALHLIRESNMEMRCALWDLYPEELQKVHLKGAIESLVKDLISSNELTARLSVEGMIRPLPADVEKCLLRISQEALSNVVKHAQAHEVQIDLFYDSCAARLKVKDDGLGFQPTSAPRSFGLNSMQERTRALGGEWTIHSEPGHGTEVHASVPIPPAMD